MGCCQRPGYNLTQNSRRSIAQYLFKEARAMRKLISTLFISRDGIVESPDKFVRPEM